jgi:hypothetical protein
VQIVGGTDRRTYHPAEEYTNPEDKCPELLIIAGTETWSTPAYSLDVSPSAFIIDKD